MNKIIYNTIIIFISISLFISCKQKDTTEPISQNPFTKGQGVFIVNEGGFGNGNASLSYLNIDSQKIRNDLYTNINSLPLGDVAQSILINGEELFVVVNNSQKITVLNANDGKLKQDILGFSSPRFICKVSDTKAYVSDLFANKISIINLQTKIISGSITIPAWTEQMLQVGNEVFVTAPGTNNIYIVDATTDQLTDSIQTVFGPNTVQKDLNGNIWAYCAGNPTNNINAALCCFNPTTRSIVKQIDLGSGNYFSGNMQINATRDTLFFAMNDIYKLPITATSLNAPLIISNGKTFYVLSIYKQHLLVTDAKDFIQAGDVLFYSKQGILKQTFSAGIAPGFMIAY